MGPAPEGWGRDQTPRGEKKGSGRCLAYKGAGPDPESEGRAEPDKLGSRLPPRLKEKAEGLTPRRKGVGLVSVEKRLGLREGEQPGTEKVTE